MPTIDSHDPGTICWIDLASTDAAGATEFYCDLFGWTATEPIENEGGYRMLLHEGKNVAGLAPVWGDTDASRWSTYVASADADETCAAAMQRRRGRDGRHGRARRRPYGGPARPGWRAGLLWQPGLHQGFEVQGEPGTPIWSELMTLDVAAARQFSARSSAGRLRSRTSTASRTRSGSAESTWSGARSRWTRAGQRAPGRTG